MNDATPAAPPALHAYPRSDAVAAALDHAADRLADPEAIPAAWPDLLAAAEQLRRAADGDGWHQALRRHPVMQLIHEEPATAWAFRRPRGYAGDAHLIDFLYEHPAVQDELRASTPRGRTMNAVILSCAAPVAVQERRRLLARLLDATAARVPNAEALVLASGHFREAELAESLSGFSRIVTLDQDAASIAEMRRCYADVAPLIPVEASIGRMIVRPLVHGRFDLIYAAGLYDYLDEATAGRLTAGMFTALKPGGRLLFANFCRGVVDYGFMDAFMDWRLIQRDETEMQRLVDTIPAADMARSTIFRGANRAAVYALIEKR